jgi:hypothetical protein
MIAVPNNHDPQRRFSSQLLDQARDGSSHGRPQVRLIETEV